MPRALALTCLLLAAAAAPCVDALPATDGSLYFTKDAIAPDPASTVRSYLMSPAAWTPDEVPLPGSFVATAQTLAFRYPVTQAWTYTSNATLSLPISCKVTGPPLGFTFALQVQHASDLSPATPTAAGVPTCVAGQQALVAVHLPTRFLRLLPGDELVVRIDGIAGALGPAPDGSTTTASLRLGDPTDAAGLRADWTLQEPRFALVHEAAWNATRSNATLLHWSTVTDGAALRIHGNATGAGASVRVTVRDLLTGDQVARLAAEAATDTGRASLAAERTLPAGPTTRWTLVVETSGEAGNVSVTLEPLALARPVVASEPMPVPANGTSTSAAPAVSGNATTIIVEKSPPVAAGWAGVTLAVVALVARAVGRRRGR